jgi:hypothetical protein
MATQLDALPCGALARRRFSDPGWTCDGTDLVFLMLGPKGIPVVGPSNVLDEFMAEPWADVYQPAPFAGGDHYHATLPSLKPQGVSER